MKTLFLSIASAVSLIMCSCTQTVPEQRRKVEPFALTEVRLLEGSRFYEAQEVNKQVLLQYEPDRLLAWFRKEAGLAPRGDVYGGWESMEIAGHSLGHYLSACSLMYASTGDRRFLERTTYNEVAREILEAESGEYVEKEYPLPGELTTGKKTVRVKLHAQEGLPLTALDTVRVLRR
jgi:hypothetical protein